MRLFKKISFNQFKSDISEDKKLYDSFPMPSRSTGGSAGYDFYLLNDITFEPGEIKKIPTGIKAEYEKDEALLIVDRSGTGFKYNLRLCNQVGLIDSDYYNNPDNEGHIWFRIQNESQNKLSFKRGDALVQGIFIKYLVTDDDSCLNKKRGSNY